MNAEGWVSERKREHSGHFSPSYDKMGKDANVAVTIPEIPNN